MNDADYEAQKARIEGYVERWVGPLGLKWWHRVEFEYERTQDWFAGNEHHGAAAVTQADWKYARATIRFNLPACAELDDADMEYVVVHECMHLFLAGMRQAVTEQAWDGDRWMPWEERTCTDLAKAFLWTREGAS